MKKTRLIPVTIRFEEHHCGDEENCPFWDCHDFDALSCDNYCVLFHQELSYYDGPVRCEECQKAFDDDEPEEDIQAPTHAFIGGVMVECSPPVYVDMEEENETMAERSSEENQSEDKKD